MNKKALREMADRIGDAIIPTHAVEHSRTGVIAGAGRSAEEAIAQAAWLSGVELGNYWKVVPWRQGMSARRMQIGPLEQA